MLPSLPANSTAEAKPPPPQRPPLRCPRCESTNTKFCYYNNYSLSQPRHFCKSCRRYWTHGGALRNVPVGGGSRKSKKHRSSSSSSGPALKLFQHPPPPVMVDFPLSNSNLQISPFGEVRNNLTPPHGSSLPNFLGLNFSYNNNSINAEEAGGLLTTSSSIESLNQLELQWKLQQQRMAVLYGHLPNCNSEPAVTNTTTAQIMEEKPQPIFFQNLEVTNPNTPTLEVGNGNGNGMHQWFFDSSYGGTSAGTSAGENDGNPTGLNSAGYVLDKDGVIKFQPYSELLAIKKV